MNGHSVEFAWPILAATEHAAGAYVLLDPDAYLVDPTYKAQRRAGTPAIRNMVAVSSSGRIVWEAELPESADYYFEIVSVSPLTAYSFSSYRCEIDSETGKIIARAFLK